MKCLKLEPEWLENIPDAKFAVANPLATALTYFEAEMKKQPQIELEVKHYFSYGIYGREMLIPKGSYAYW